MLKSIFMMSIVLFFSSCLSDKKEEQNQRKKVEEKIDSIKQFEIKEVERKKFDLKSEPTTEPSKTE